MRQSHQNRRNRGRSRKSQSPLTRSYESAGPDVKIRGNPSHIAEKYMALARDALSAGDPVLAENYLQHAEHYNRIIMAHREQHPDEGGQRPRQGESVGGEPASGDAGDDDERDEAGSAQPVPGKEPQPVLQAGDDGEASERPQRRSNGRSAPRGSSSGRGRRSRYAKPDDQPDFLKRPVRRSSSADTGGDEGDDASAKADQAAE